MTQLLDLAFSSNLDWNAQEEEIEVEIKASLREVTY